MAEETQRGFDARRIAGAIALALALAAAALAAHPATAHAYETFAPDAVANRFSIAPTEGEPEVAVEWHDYVEEQDGTAAFTRVSWNNATLNVQKGAEAAELAIFSVGCAGTQDAPEPYAYISDEYGIDEVNRVLCGTMASFSGLATSVKAADPLHVLSVRVADNPDPQTKGGKTYVKHIIEVGWQTTELPARALLAIGEHAPYQAVREGLSFAGWSKPVKVAEASGEAPELWRTDASWIAPEEDREVRMLWRDGRASGDTVSFNRVAWNNATAEVAGADGESRELIAYSVGNDGTTDNPDIWCFFWEGYTEEELQGWLNGAQAQFEGLLVPADAGYIINVYRDYGNSERPVKNGLTYLKYRIRLTVWPETTIKMSQMGDLRSAAPYIPTRDGYRFLGWSAPEKIGEDYYQTFARWEKGQESEGGPAYAALYGDVLVIARGQEVPKNYEGRPLAESWRGIEEGLWGGPADVPWDGRRAEVREVVCAAEVRPSSVAWWFSGMGAGKIDVSKLDVSACASAEGTFSGNTVLESLDLRTWGTPSLRKADSMFSGCASLKTIYVSTRWDASKAGEGTDMFAGCHELMGGNGLAWSESFTGASMAVIDTDMSPGYLTLAKAEAYAALYDDGTLEFGRGDVAPQTRGSASLVGAWTGIESDRYSADTVPWRAHVSEVAKVTFSDSVSPVSCAYWFNAMGNLSSCALAGLDMSRTDDVQLMFANCTSLAGVDFSAVDMSSVRYFAGMLYGCTSLASVDLSGQNLDAMEGMGNLFYGCTALQSVRFPDKWDSSALLRMNGTFFNCTSLKSIDLSMLDTSNVVRMTNCFAGCTSLETIYASDKFTTGSVTEAQNIFGRSPLLTGQNGTVWKDSWVDNGLSYARIDEEGAPGMFTEKGADPGPGPDEPGPDQPGKYPDDAAGRLMAAMTLKEKVCQMFCVYPESLTAESGAPTLTVMGDAQRATLAEYPFGGICAFLPNITSEQQAVALISDMQAASEIPLLTGVDEEGGRVQRIGGTTYDGARRGAGIGHQLNAMQTYEPFGEAKARENARLLAQNCKRLGFNWDFAPVADVNSNPANTVIGPRAYSSDYATAAKLVSAAVAGFADEGVGTSLKHFPGHGDTSTDSHIGAAQVEKSKSELLAEDLVPFTAAIEAGAGSVMVGHLIVPAIDPDNPATVSKPIVTGLLREEMGFDGIVVTDGMQMGALTKVYGTSKAGYVNATLACLDAGIDVFLLPGYPRAGVDAIVAKVESGEVSEDRIDASVRRILLFKEKLGLI